MRLSHITLTGFKSFAKKTTLDVNERVTGVVGPNGSGKSNIAEAIRFVLGEQSMKIMRGKVGTDVIFKGSEHLAPLSRASVTMTIDNKDKVDTTHASSELAPYLVYDELVLSRVIYADGTSDYMLNDAKIRLKDVQELLSFAGIGSSAHTIISQGEADKILLASPKDKKEALEDALGLRVYHIRLAESRRKLDRVRSHVREVSLLRNEIKPHLAHLERQVKKIESEQQERQTLHSLLNAYFVKEEREIAILEEQVNASGSTASLQLVTNSIQSELELLREKKHSHKDVALMEKERLQTELRALYMRRDHMAKTLGRLEAEKSFMLSELHRSGEKKDVVIAMTDFADAHAKIAYGLETLGRSLDITDYSKAIDTHLEVATEVETFFTVHTGSDVLREKKMKLEESIQGVDIATEEHKKKESELLSQIRDMEGSIESLRNQDTTEIVTRHEEEKKVLQLESKLRELGSIIALRRQEEGEIAQRKQYFENLLREGVLIVGRQVFDYRTSVILDKYQTLSKHELERHIERSKLKIEEASVPNRDEVIAEFKSTKEREEYLSRELSDIEESEKKLLALIDELTESLSEKFSYGVTHVSKVFSEFFSEVFPGGKAKLSQIEIIKVDDEGVETKEVGIDIDVALPNKKVKELTMFSGGERTLVSIALLFAMSSITPPPFMVLDETDAPLDESNARKYGLMLKRLAEKSKLLVITHNRETMNHCDMLYGVTIGVDGGSKLLSVNFKQAEEYAK